MTKTKNALNADLKSYSIGQIKGAVEILITLKKPLFLWGPVGVGKSDLFRQIAAEQNRNLIDIRLSQMDLTDLKGMPVPNHENKKMEWWIASNFPTDENDNSIIFFDELNCAQPAVQATAYQLILDRRVGDYKLPDNVSIVAAGNREGDRGITFRMPAPLLNRFTHLEVKYDAESWITWAENNNIHPLIVSYLQNNRKDISAFDPTVSNRAFATPRTWKNVSDFLYGLKEIPSKKKSPEYLALEQLISGAIGLPLCGQLLRWVEIGRHCPSLSDVVMGKAKSLDITGTEKLSVLNSMTHELCKFLEEKSKTLSLGIEEENTLFYSMWENAFKFIQQNSDGNLEIVMNFSTVTTKKIEARINTAKMPAMQAFMNDPHNKEFLSKQISAMIE